MLDKTGQTGSPLQLVNGMILISTFACARLIYGWIIVRASWIYATSMVLDHLMHGLFPVLQISPNANRGAGRALECDLRGVRLWKFHPERAERVLVNIDSLFPFLSPEFCLAKGDVNRFSRMIAALQKRFTEKDTKAASAPQHKNALDRHGAARTDGERVMTRRGEAKRKAPF